MIANDLWSLARRRLEELGCDPPNVVQFVDDRLVAYSVPDGVTVTRTDLFGLEDDERWRAYFEPVPTWLHFNLLTTKGGEQVVTVRRSPEPREPDDTRIPPLNVSAEPTAATIVDS